jgi:hypothetical protein
MPSGYIHSEPRAARSISPPEFEFIKAVYPQRAGSHEWPEALIRCLKRIKEGHSWEDLTEGAKRYQVYCEACETVGSQYVKRAVVFFGPKNHFLDEWRLPSNKAEIRRDHNIDVSQDWLSREQH